MSQSETCKERQRREEAGSQSTEGQRDQEADIQKDKAIQRARDKVVEVHGGKYTQRQTRR
jgi:hypothetical protein